MPANNSKYRLSLAEHSVSNFEVLNFTGTESISRLYRFVIEFKLSGQTSSPPDDSVLGKPCRLDIEQNGEMFSYCGIAVEFSVRDSDDVNAGSGSGGAGVHYTVSLAPKMHELSLRKASRIFQRRTVPLVLKKVVEDAGLSEYFEFKLDENNAVKYPEREFCVQHNESDLDFISRLMEDSGIWYWFKQIPGGKDGGAVKERAVITDDFSRFPLLGRDIPFMKGGGFSQTDGSGNGDKIIESVKSLALKSALMPESVRMRAYNHHLPEPNRSLSVSDGFSSVPDGKSGSVYEYGGHIDNDIYAKHRAALCAKRTWVENRSTNGEGNSAAFKSGLQVSIKHKDNDALSGTYLILSVTHRGGWNNKAYWYRNEFTCVRAASKIYAPSLYTPVPRIDGVMTAPVGAAGAALPTLNQYGYYNVNMPSDLREDSGAGDYDRSKHIRVAQPSCGVSVDGEKEKGYGFHFPAKQGSEMVLAYVDGDPDRPVGLGFVPNTASPSLVNNYNPSLNVMRTWGGNVLAMDDATGSQKIVLATSGNDHFESRSDSITVRSQTPVGELLLDNGNKATTLRAFKHKFVLSYNEEENAVVITTEAGNFVKLDDKNEYVTVQTKNGNVIKMDDAEDVITVQSSDAENKVTVNGKETSISLDSKGNVVTLNGKDEKITVESKDSKGVFDGKGKKIALEHEDNKVVIDGGGGMISLNAKNSVNIKAGKKLIIDAKDGIENKGAKIKLTK